LSAEIAGAVAMVRGHSAFHVDTQTNKKLARVSKAGRATLAIQVDTGVLHIWALASEALLLHLKIPKDIRTYGYDRHGLPAVPGQPGMHSGLAPFFSTNELTCFNPASLDQAWLIIKAFGI
jgi:hypothetical protein